MMFGSRLSGAILALSLLLIVPGWLSPAGAQDKMLDQADLIHTLLPSVVNIVSRARAATDSGAMTASSDDSSDSFEVKVSNGSGFVIDPDGTILTNWHVVAGAYEIVVSFTDGTRLDAEVVNAARLIDLALLKVHSPKPLHAVTWGDIDKVRIGDSVLAIGNPLGVGTSVTRGIVSALHRNINDTPYDDFIQTDAAINHGNSGGPLFNMKGEVIGVDSAIISPTAANAGLGFALPAYQAQFVIEQLKKFGWIRPGWLGLKIQDVTDDMAKALGIPPRGAIVAWISANGPAEKAGVRIGDVIVRFDDDHPADERDLLRHIAGASPGQTVALGVLRDGKPVELKATEAEWPRMAWEEANAPLKVTPPHWMIPADLGISLTGLTEQLRTENDLPQGHPGAFVTDVKHGTDAARRGLKPGDVILQVGTAPVDGGEAVLREVQSLRKSGKKMAMFLVFPKNRGSTVFPSPKWIALRIGDG